MKFLNKFNESKENKFNVPDAVIKLAFKYVKDISEITDAYLVEGTEDLYIIHTTKKLLRSEQYLKLIYINKLITPINPYFKFSNKIEFESLQKELDNIMDIIYYTDPNNSKVSCLEYEKVSDIISDSRYKKIFYYFLLIDSSNLVESNIKNINCILQYPYVDENSFEEISSELTHLFLRIKENNWGVKEFSIKKRLNYDSVSVKIILEK